MIMSLFVIAVLYLILIFSFIYGFDKVKSFETYYQPYILSFSVVIPFRNEAEHLPLLLESICKVTYSINQYEFIFVDDDSSDNSVEIIHQYLATSKVPYSIINNQRSSNSPKKDAINTAISKSQYEWIITTDADCILPENWLHRFGEFATVKNSKMVVGPVMFHSNDSSFLEHFQILDILSLQGTTAGTFGIDNPILCNGANLAYKKEVFLELNGFAGNDTIASGDDIFLLEKFYKAYPEQVHFLKSNSAIVKTHPVKTWKELINQRMRWAAKSGAYSLWFGKLVGMIVLLMNVATILSLILICIDLKNSIYYLDFLILKLILDFVLIHKASVFYRGKNKKIRSYILGSLLYPFFSLYIVFKIITSKYDWKGRSFKQ